CHPGLWRTFPPISLHRKRASGAPPGRSGIPTLGQHQALGEPAGRSIVSLDGKHLNYNNWNDVIPTPDCQDRWGASFGPPSPGKSTGDPMSNLLFVKSSLFGPDGKSSQIASEFIDAFRQFQPGTTVVERRLDADSIPHLSGATFAAVTTPSEKR